MPRSRSGRRVAKIKALQAENTLLQEQNAQLKLLLQKAASLQSYAKPSSFVDAELIKRLESAGASYHERKSQWNSRRMGAGYNSNQGCCCGQCMARLHDIKKNIEQSISLNLSLIDNLPKHPSDRHPNPRCRCMSSFCRTCSIDGTNYTNVLYADTRGR